MCNSASELNFSLLQVHWTRVRITRMLTTHDQSCGPKSKIGETDQRSRLHRCFPKFRNRVDAPAQFFENKWRLQPHVHSYIRWSLSSTEKRFPSIKITLMINRSSTSSRSIHQAIPPMRPRTSLLVIHYDHEFNIERNNRRGVTMSAVMISRQQIFIITVW